MGNFTHLALSTRHVGGSGYHRSNDDVAPRKRVCRRVLIVKGTVSAARAVKPLHFSGYDWEFARLQGSRGNE